jgi:hypothetical protein
MKVTNIIIICCTVLACSSLAWSCRKKTGKDAAVEENDFGNKSLVQVFNATVNSTGTIHVFIDGSPVTGAALTYGTVFPSSAYAFQVNAGLRSFSIRSTSAGTTQTPIIFAENMEVGKNYTIFMYDTITAAKQVTVLNKIVTPSDTTARVKFVNFIYNNGVPPAVDVFSKVRNENIFTNITTTQATEYIPYATRVSDTLLIRQTGTATLLATLNGFNPLQKRSYTLIYRGSFKGTSVLSSFVNY